MVSFLGLNVVIVGLLLLGVLIYLLVLVNKRRQERFLHKSDKDNET